MNDLLKEIVVKIAQEHNFEFNIKAKYIDNNKNEEN